MKDYSKIHTAYQSIQGRRRNNQDRASILNTKTLGHPATIIVVADGMGGLDEGDKAAEIAIATVERYAKEVFPVVIESQEQLRAAIYQMFKEANGAIYSYGVDHQLGSIGTTLVFAIILNGRYLVANAGDSRCYYINAHHVSQVTEDHSMVQELVNEGSMTQEAARRSPYRNQLTNYLGEPGEIRIDIFPTGNNFGIIKEVSALMVCSDGLHGDLELWKMHQHLLASHKLQTICDNLVKFAFEKGSTDNITIAIAAFGKLSSLAKANGFG